MQGLLNKMAKENEERINRKKQEFEVIHFHSDCTCKDCGVQYTCVWSWDLYNTSGDCIASK